MKIFIVNQHPDVYLGGSEVQCDIIGRELVKLGHTVHYLAYSSEGRFPMRDAYPYEIIPFTLDGNEFKKLLMEFDPDLIYWRLDRKGLFNMLPIAKMQQKKFVFAISHIDNVMRPKLKLVKPNSFISIKKNLKSIRSYIQNRQSYNTKLIYQIDGLTSLNPDYLNVLPIQNQAYIPNSMYMNAQPFVWKKQFCVWVANIKSAKNPEIFINLARQEQFANTDFLMIGKIQEPEYNWIETGKDLPPNFHYLGPRSLEFVNGVIGQSLFLVHTCSPEGFCNNFIQAWIQGKPTITLFYDPNRTIVNNRLGFHSKSFNQLIIDTETLLKDELLRDQLGENARQFGEMFNAEKNVKKLERFFIKLLAA